MSSIAITGGATGTGVFSLLAPSTSTNRTLTLPDSAGTVATAESTLSQFNASGSAPVYACRAWVNFNGTGTVAIRGSGNVSSITDNGTGDYTVNFVTAMPDANYTVLGAAMRNTDGSSVQYLLTARNSSTYSNSYTTTSIRMLSTRTDNGTDDDAFAANVSIFR